MEWKNRARGRIEVNFVTHRKFEVRHVWSVSRMMMFFYLGNDPDCLGSNAVQESYRSPCDIPHDIAWAVAVRDVGCCCGSQARERRKTERRFRRRQSYITMARMRVLIDISIISVRATFVRRKKIVSSYSASFFVSFSGLKSLVGIKNLV